MFTARSTLPGPAGDGPNPGTVLARLKTRKDPCTLLGLAFASAAVAPLVPPASSALAWINGWFAAYIAACAHVVGGLPGAQIRFPDTHASSGLVDVEVRGIGNHPPWEWLRHFIEVTEENAHLLEQYERST